MPSSPPVVVRRKLQREGDALHDIIQVSMGWTDSHPHQFMVGEHCFAPRYGDLGIDDLGCEDESHTRLREVAPPERRRFRYEYDFGDGWEHVILVEKVLPRDPDQPLPVCLKGVRACPPEDVGGVWGYEGFLEAIRDPDHPEHDTYVEWAGPFEPEEFDLEAVNATLSHMQKAHCPRRS